MKEEEGKGNTMRSGSKLSFPRKRKTQQQNIIQSSCFSDAKYKDKSGYSLVFLSLFLVATKKETQVLSRDDINNKR
jgi:hypothetical protein